MQIMFFDGWLILLFFLKALKYNEQARYIFIVVQNNSCSKNALVKPFIDEPMSRRWDSIPVYLQKHYLLDLISLLQAKLNNISVLVILQ